VIALGPIWSADFPISYALVIKELPGQSDGDLKEPKGTVSSKNVAHNDLNLEIEREITWRRMESSKSSIELSTESRSRIGAKVGFEVSAEVEGGIPGLGQVKAGMKASGEASAEDEKAHSFRDGHESSVEREVVVTDKIKIPPRTTVKGTFVATEYQMTNVRWKGEMKVIYASGSTRSLPVYGTLTSSSASEFTSEYTVVDGDSKELPTKGEVFIVPAKVA
jgi:hypothetical protein